MSIPEEVEAILSQYAKKLDVPIEELKDHYQKLLEEAVKEHPKSKRIYQMALTRLRGHLIRTSGLLSNAPIYMGIIIGDSGVLDFIEIQKNKALALWRKNPDEAVKLGLCREDGTPLDQRKLVNFKPNPNYKREPYQEGEHDYTRTLYGFALIPPDYTNLSFFSLIFRGDDALKVKYPFSSWVKFRANPSKDSSPKHLVLNASSVTKFTPVEVPMEDIEDLIYKNNEIYKLTDLPELMDFFKDSRDLILIEADVLYVNPTEKRTVLRLDDQNLMSDNGVICFLDKDIPPPKEDSRIIVLGNLGTISSRDGSESICIRARGYYLLY